MSGEIGQTSSPRPSLTRRRGSEDAFGTGMQVEEIDTMTVRMPT